ncbi:MAG: abortive infection family protein [Bryobacteraceae bacterium]
MLALYHGSGATDFTLVDKQAEDSWDEPRRKAIRLLEVTNDREAGDLLRQCPLELWSGTNYFRDRFFLLFFRTGIEEYLALEARLSEERMIQEYVRVVRALERFGLTPRFVAVDMDMELGVESVARPHLQITTEIVERALSEAELLILSSGAAGALDRLHTAFHGYLKALCDSEKLGYGSDPSITDVFKIIRNQHPAIQGASQREEEVGNILKGVATIVDAINRLRNRRSMAHPNGTLLEESEAMLVITPFGRCFTISTVNFTSELSASFGDISSTACLGDQSRRSAR